MPKRPALSGSAELETVKCELYDLIASVWEKTPAEVHSAAAIASDSATILDLGLTSAMGISLKGMVVRQMEAELTTFQLLKQPIQQVIEDIGARRRKKPARNLCAQRCFYAHFARAFGGRHCEERVARRDYSGAGRTARWR